MLSHVLKLRFRLDPLGDYLEPEVLREADDHFRDRAATVVRLDALNEVLVDLQRIEREFVQVGQL